MRYQLEKFIIRIIYDIHILYIINLLQEVHMENLSTTFTSYYITHIIRVIEVYARMSLKFIDSKIILFDMAISEINLFEKCIDIYWRTRKFLDNKLSRGVLFSEIHYQTFTSENWNSISYFWKRFMVYWFLLVHHIDRHQNTYYLVLEMLVSLYSKHSIIDWDKWWTFCSLYLFE